MDSSTTSLSSMSSSTSSCSQHCRVTGVSTSKDKYGIRQTTYKFLLKLELDSGILNFTNAFTTNLELPVPIFSTRQSPPLSNKGSKYTGVNDTQSPFSFHFELERDSKRGSIETCTMFLKRSSSSKEKATFIKYAVAVDCPCKNGKVNDERNPDSELVADPYPDCNQSEMVDFMYRPHLPIDKHTHDCNACGLGQTYFVTVTELDFSTAMIFPYEAQDLLAKRTFQKDVRETDGKYFEALSQPFDTTIICKDGYEIDVHAFVLSTRNAVFKKILSSSNFKMVGRGSSFRKLARDAFIGKSERYKKSKTVTIDESEVDSGAMKAVLHFIYFGELDSHWKSDLSGVLYAAKKYGVKQLLDLINSLVITLCMKTNALSLLKLTQQYALTGAECAVTDYIYTNLAGVLQASVKITSV